MGSFEWHTKTFLWMASHTKSIKILCHKREEESIYAKLLPSLAGNMAKKNIRFSCNSKTWPSNEEKNLTHYLHSNFFLNYFFFYFYFKL